jgi:hypothetical protein
MQLKYMHEQRQLESHLSLWLETEENHETPYLDEDRPDAH